MGNCSGLLRASEGSYCLKAVKAKPKQKVVQVVKLDGKILEFKVPLLVKDVLIKYPGSGIGLSKMVPHHLPLIYELKMGKVYYIIPETGLGKAATKKKTGGGVKRIKVVITKLELQQLLTKQLSVEEVLARLEKRKIVSPRNWKPKLESILEENE